MDERAQGAIAANMQRVQARMQDACHRVGRAPDEVQLVAVTKTRSAEEIQAAYACGLRDFGENRVEEAEDKLALVTQSFAEDPPTWHLIGHIQSRKAARAAAIADVVHSLDSLRLAHRLERAAAEVDRTISVLIQINVSGEASKGGFPAWDPSTQRTLFEELEPIGQMVHLKVEGLMTMAPIVPDPELARPVFRSLRQLRDKLRSRLNYSSWHELSMGMTDDFEIAIEEGATLVRVGRAIFGPRSA
jgi:pyridoxal phosphate enzyme (YggS family)